MEGTTVMIMPPGLREDELFQVTEVGDACSVSSIGLGGPGHQLSDHYPTGVGRAPSDSHAYLFELLIGPSPPSLLGLH